MPIINLALETPEVQQILTVLDEQPHKAVAPLIQKIVQQANAQLAAKPPASPENPTDVPAEPETPAAASVRRALKKSKLTPLPVSPA